MTRHPFQYLLPVSPDDFIGAWALVEETAADLADYGGDSHAIIAGRRCGKSSMLVALRHQLGQLRTSDLGDWTTLPLLFDFKSDTFDSAGVVFARMLHEIRRRVDVTMSRRSQDAYPAPVKLGADWFQPLADKPTLSLSDYEDALGYILDQLGTPLKPVRLVMLLDEMDVTLGHKWTAALYNQLRSLISIGALKEQVRLVLTGSRRFLDEVSDGGSPLWNVLKLHYLQTFDKTATDQLINRAEGLPEEAALAVWQQSGGHPFLVQYLLYHLWEDGPTNADATAVERLSARFRHERFPDLEGWTRAVETTGLRVYHTLASPPDWVDESDIVRTINDPTCNVKRGLMALCYHGLIVHDGSWERYKRTGDLFKAWFDEQEVAALVGDAAVTVELVDGPSKTPPVVFISYSHADENEKNKLVTHLKVLEKTGILALWVDDRIMGGADWEEEIKEAMTQASIAILLISANFLASDFILGEEVPGCLERRYNEGLTVFPIIAKDCVWQAVDWLAAMNVRPKNSTPIWSGDNRQVDRDLAAIAKEVADIIRQI